MCEWFVRHVCVTRMCHSLPIPTQVCMCEWFVRHVCVTRMCHSLQVCMCEWFVRYVCEYYGMSKSMCVCES